MAKVQVTLGRLRVGAYATIESHRVRQRPMLAGIVYFHAVLEMLQCPREVALEEQRLADLVVSREELERLSRALGGCQSRLCDLGRGREVALRVVGHGHTHEQSRQLGRLADLGRQLAHAYAGSLALRMRRSPGRTERRPDRHLLRCS